MKAQRPARPDVPPDTFPDIPIPPECQALLDDGALLAVNSSGGKDSQCMTILLSRIVPPEQLLVVHAPLRDVDWPGTLDHIRATLPDQVPLILAPIASGKTLLDRIAERTMFPSKRTRYCTSELKRGPIERELRRYLKRNPYHRGRIINAIGIRRTESRDRENRDPWAFNNRNSRAGRRWYDWLPLYELTDQQVFATIRAAGQLPHWVYAQGARRCSCSFCIFSSAEDLRLAARLRPRLYHRYVELERRFNHTLSLSRRFLPDLTGVPGPTEPRTKPRSPHHPATTPAPRHRTPTAEVEGG